MAYITKKQKILSAVGIAAIAVGIGVVVAIAMNGQAAKQQAEEAAEAPVKVELADLDWYSSLDKEGREFVDYLVANRWLSSNGSNVLEFHDDGTYKLKQNGQSASGAFSFTDVSAKTLNDAQAVIHVSDADSCVLTTHPVGEESKTVVEFNTDGYLTANCFGANIGYYRMAEGTSVKVSGLDSEAFKSICPDVAEFTERLMAWAADNAPSTTEITWKKTYQVDADGDNIVTQFDTNSANGMVIGAIIDQKTGNAVFSDARYLSSTLIDMHRGSSEAAAASQSSSSASEASPFDASSSSSSPQQYDSRESGSTSSSAGYSRSSSASSGTASSSAASSASNLKPATASGSKATASGSKATSSTGGNEGTKGQDRQEDGKNKASLSSVHAD